MESFKMVSEWFCSLWDYVIPGTVEKDQNEPHFRYLHLWCVHFRRIVGNNNFTLYNSSTRIWPSPIVHVDGLRQRMLQDSGKVLALSFLIPFLTQWRLPIASRKRICPRAMSIFPFVTDSDHSAFRWRRSVVVTQHRPMTLWVRDSLSLISGRNFGLLPELMWLLLWRHGREFHLCTKSVLFRFHSCVELVRV